MFSNIPMRLGAPLQMARSVTTSRPPFQERSWHRRGSFFAADRLVTAPRRRDSRRRWRRKPASTSRSGIDSRSYLRSIGRRRRRADRRSSRPSAKLLRARRAHPFPQLVSRRKPLFHRRLTGLAAKDLRRNPAAWGSSGWDGTRGRSDARERESFRVLRQILDGTGYSARRTIVDLSRARRDAGPWRVRRRRRRFRA